ncbi:MAG: class I SAM-dependent methyltransferase [Clostridium sp.]|nr:class I SAM-dependent methyltransferase [Clostridium sp.]MCM1458787.1 class I SAM-dependent methyltransferase [Bacteroides sp.]
MKSFNDGWEKIHAENAWGKYPSEHVVRFVARNYYKKERKAVRILDFGCGAGAHTWFLAREGFDTYAFDGSKSAVERAKAYLEKEGLKADFKVMDAVEQGYANDFFDCVIDNVTVYANKLDDIRRMYQNIYNMLKEGGTILTAVFSKNTQGYGEGEEIEKDTFISVQLSTTMTPLAHYFDEGSLTDILAEIGFKDICMETSRYTDRGNTVEHIIVSAVK